MKPLAALGRYKYWLIAAVTLLAVAVVASSGGQAGGSSAEERRIAEVLSAIEGAGRVEVALYFNKAATAFGETAQSKPCGMVIVAEGAQDLRVRLTLIRAGRTLLGLPEDAVDVFTMKEAP